MAEKVGTKTGSKTRVGRDVYETPEGKKVSEISTTFEYKGQWINVPTIHNGYVYDEEILKMMLDAEVIEPTSVHKSETDAVKAARDRSESFKFNEGGLTAQTEEALGWTAEGEKFADANPVEVEQDQESTALSIANVPVFDRPMDASENDKWTGVQDELGNRQYKTIFGRKYFVRLADDQRTNYEKIQQDIIPAVKNYLDNPTAPSREQTINFLKESLGAAWETFKIPGDLAAGNKGMEDVTLGNIFELAGGTGALSTVSKVPGDSSNTTRIFGGVGMKGAGTDKGFKKAKKLLKKRQSELAYPSETGQIDFDTNKKIWQQTNWYVDPNDGQWRFYIDDSKSELRPFKEAFKVDPEAGLTFKELSEKNIPRENSKSVLLKNFFDHTDLYEKYPELEELNVGFYSDPGSRILGSADSKNNTIYLNLASYENYEDMKSVVLHEIQHIVQEKEGFVPGSNERSIPPELVKKQEMEIATKIKPDVEAKAKLEAEERAVKFQIKEQLKGAKIPLTGLTAKQEQEIFKIKPNDGGPSWASLGRKYGVPPRTVQKAWGRVNLLNYLRGKERELNLALTKIESNLFSAGMEIDGIEFEFYQGAGGEIESRLVQAMASGERGLANDGFPVSARNSMLGKEGNKYQYRGKEGVDPLVYTNQPRRDPDQKSFLDKLKSKVGVSNNSELESSQVRRYRDDLDPEVYDAFDELAEIQRGAPEIAMTSAQKALEGGVLSYALEHTGDLTHRMAEKGGVYGAEYVKPKVNRLLDSLLSEYGFEKEHLENLKNTAQFNYDKLGKNTNLSFEQYYKNYVDNAQEKIKIYAEEHKKVPVYNDMQLAGREAAIAIGEGRYTDAVEHLYLIRSAIDDGTYRQKSVEFNPKIDFRKELDQGFAQGGVVNNMNNQMSFAFAEGGLRDDGMGEDPVSGNEVPSGSMAKEVRDDIPAQLSEGEYVVPADVVRYYGVKFFEDIRDSAKMGLQDMESRGRIGGEPVPAGGPTNDDELSPEEMSAIQGMMGMAEGGIVNMYKQQQDLYSPPNPAVGNNMMNAGGQVKGYAPGGLETGQNMEQQLLTAGQQAQPFVPQPLGSSLFPSANTNMAEVTTPTTFVPVKMLNMQTNHSVMANTQQEFDDYSSKGYVVDDGTLKPQPTGGGGGGGSTTTPTVNKEPYKDWLASADFNSAEGLSKFVEGIEYDPSKSNLDMQTLGATMIAGPMAGIATGLGGVFRGGGLQAISDLRAASLIAKAQGMDKLATKIDTKVANIIKDGPKILDFLDDIFASGKQKANAWAKKNGHDNIEVATKAGVTPTPPVVAAPAANNDDNDDPFKDVKAQVAATKAKGEELKKTNAAVASASAQAEATQAAEAEMAESAEAAGATKGGPGGTYGMNKGGLMAKGKKKKNKK